LNTTLTPELVREGLARDLVRLVQDARKSAGFAITDRINLVLHPQAELKLESVLGAYGEYIRSATLASTLTVGPLPAGYFAVEIELEFGRATLGVQRCER